MPHLYKNKACRERCYQKHINYTILCARCEEEREKAKRGDAEQANIPPKYVYYGETSRGAYIRFEQHMASLRAKVGSLWEHVAKYHHGDTGTGFIMEVHATDTDPMRRIIRESVRIEEGRTDESVELLNSKDEYYGVQTVQIHFTQE